MRKYKKILNIVSNKIESFRRVLKVARKPSREEFIKTLEISIIFILMIGIVGFIIYFISVLVR